MSERSALDRAVAAAFPILIGGLLLRLVVTGRYRDVVKASMWPWLTLAAFGLVAAAAWELASSRAMATHRPRVAWLLLAPVVLVLGIPPRPLGAAALDRAGRLRAPSTYADGSWARLPADGVPIPMTIGEFVERTYAGDTTRGVPVVLTGFVAPDDEGGSFRVVRFRISCCAADAAPVAVRITAPPADGVPPADTWVRVTGTLVPDEPAALDPRFELRSLERIDEPVSPYEVVTTP